MAKDREASSTAVHGVAKVGQDLVTEQQQLVCNVIISLWIPRCHKVPDTEK